ncbi:MAG: hypothetical protein JNL96_06385 [Planctomycetaceae bacterium]|nr:hypothetical protein [Planctomycetaceae bacterium]
MMLTLTVDPKLFPTPLEAFQFLRKRRCVAKALAELHHKGLLHSRRYFYVVEWQMGKGNEAGTEMPHFHVLVDADFIPFEALKEAWNKYRPKWAPPVFGNAPAFGHVRISKRSFAGGAAHAAHYACKYLMKHPEKGYPEYVRFAKLQIKRFSTSRGLLASGKPATPRDRRDKHADDCSCGECEARRERRTTIAERTARCGQTTILTRVPLHATADGELKEGRPRFIARAKVPFAEVLWLMGVEDEPATSYEVTPAQWEDILRLDESQRGLSDAVSLSSDHPLIKGHRRKSA